MLTEIDSKLPLLGPSKQLVELLLGYVEAESCVEEEEAEELESILEEEEAEELESCIAHQRQRRRGLARCLSAMTIQ